MAHALLPRLAARLGPPADPPDAALLARFATEGCPEAFARLVARHGPMVLAVCRRVLGNAPDADDAFQAAFLVLVRRAADVRQPHHLAGWLYGVAYRTALEARTVRAWRRKRETAADPLPDVPQAPACPDPDLPAVVERELAALPDHLRAAVALCDLDGRTRAEAAALLGIPEGTLSSRLHDGRKRLAGRLARKGYGMSAAITPVVPAAAFDAAVRLADGPASAGVQQLSSEVLRAMTTNRKLIGWVAAGLLTVAVGTAAVFAGGVNPPRERDDKKADPKPAAKPDGGDKKVGDAPPVVVKTVPAAGDEVVDPGLKEMSVTFSKEMNGTSWSWSTSPSHGAALPSGDNKPTFSKDKKTYTLAVTLQPDTTYAVWLNSDKFPNFKDADGNSSLPYLLVFRTGKGK